MAVHHVLNLGAGVQSTALYLMSCEPGTALAFDAAVFADTGEEPQAVYDHLAWLQSLGGPPIHVRSFGKLGDDLVSGRPGTAGRFSSIPAFAAEDHRTRPRFCAGVRAGMVPRHCTHDYKIRVVERSIRRDVLGLKPGGRVPKGVLVWQYFGITTDERRRAEKARSRFDKVRWARPVWPLLEMGWSRADCLKYLRDKVPHKVPKSACVFCPYRDDESWRRLRDEDPLGWARAVEIDAALREEGTAANRDMQKRLYLHRSCVPLPMADLSRHEEIPLGGLRDECEGMCGV